MNSILIVDDEQSILDSLSMFLTYNGYEVSTARDGLKAIEKIKKREYDLVLLDIKMPKMDGIEVLEKMMEINKELVIIMISGHGNIENAVEATKKGAYNFIQKPLPDLHELKLTVRNAIEYKKSKAQINRMRSELIEANRIIGSSTSINEVRTLITKYADVNLNVLITGESGTGKMLVANQIHLNSRNADKPFTTINCAALTDSNIEEILFGKYADDEIKNPGKIVESNGGTIFFDEISHLSIDAQTKILKVIEENKFTRSFQSEEIKIDARFIFSTNKDIENEITEGRFIGELYHRINVLRINVPPLRERPEDIEDLVKYFVSKICKAYNIPEITFTPDAVSLFQQFRWPGNVRELRNTIERLIFTTDKNKITSEDIELPVTKYNKIFADLFSRNMSLNEYQNESEKIFLEKMLNDYKYNISQTAEALKIQRSHLYKLMSKYNIPLPSRKKGETD
ncbi:MAG: sigma-54-dependent Fis family transcriptional regulator [Ignavibacteria bacterium]|nr:sigma-54-dependent Fis family transcriptional regulator [Ignavibacteria bacterium]